MIFGFSVFGIMIIGAIVAVVGIRDLHAKITKRKRKPKSARAAPWDKWY